MRRLWRSPKVLNAILLAVGLGLAAVLISREGWGDVATTLGTVGWGLLGVAVFHLVPLAADTRALQLLVDRRAGIGYFRFGWILWIGESINTLLPVAQIGGEFVKTRLFMMRGVRGSQAGAYVVVNLTLSALTQGLFTLVGLALLLIHYGDGEGVAASVGVSAAIFLALVAGFLALQRYRMFQRIARAIEKLAKGHVWLSIVGSAERLDEAVIELYRNRRIILHSAFWQFVSWIVGTGEVWLILYLMGSPVSILDAMLLESLGQAVRSAAFVVPGAFGVQEGAFLILGGMLGLTPDVSLGLSLAKRARDIILGIPGLISWQVVEARGLFRKASDDSDTRS